MNKTDAKKIAKIITNEQLLAMFKRVKSEIVDWTKVSSCNKGMTKGVAWNILAKDFDVNKEYSNLAKVNMVREFGEFLPDELKIKKEPKNSTIPPVHQDPIFDD